MDIEQRKKIESTEGLEEEEIEAYEHLRERHGFLTVWSIEGMRDWGQRAFPGKVALVAAGSETSLTDPTWLDLWRATDGLVRKSGDEDHRFIEEYTYSPSESRLTVFLGS